MAVDTSIRGAQQKLVGEAFPTWKKFMNTDDLVNMDKKQIPSQSDLQECNIQSILWPTHNKSRQIIECENTQTFSKDN